VAKATFQNVVSNPDFDRHAFAGYGSGLDQVAIAGADNPFHAVVIGEFQPHERCGKCQGQRVEPVAAIDVGTKVGGHEQIIARAAIGIRAKARFAEDVVARPAEKLGPPGPPK
jgi:hypothetical protein